MRRNNKSQRVVRLCIWRCGTSSVVDSIGFFLPSVRPPAFVFAGDAEPNDEFYGGRRRGALNTSLARDLSGVRFVSAGQRTKGRVARAQSYMRNVVIP